MINSSVIGPVVNAFSYAHTLAACKADDDAARQGCNIPLATINQFLQTYTLIQQVKHLEEISGQVYVS